MKLVTYRRADGAEVAGIVRADKVVEVGQSAPQLPTTVRGLLEADALSALATAVEGADVSAAPGIDDVELCAPLPQPGKIICLAGNYQEHIREEGGPGKDKATSPPHLFMKPATTVLPPNGTIGYPSITDQLDHEIELGVVIGRPAKGVAEADALACVAGYTICNDVSSRRIIDIVNPDRERTEREKFFDWLIGKWQDGALPMGPYLVTGDEVNDALDLAMKLWVNGDLRQQGSTGQMIYTAAEIVAFVSRLTTLEPGDIISTGTPAGVGAATGKFLKPDDRVECEIEGLGRLTTHVGAA